MQENTKPKIVTMYHDGACPLCALEVKKMQRLDTSQSVRWVDISKNKEKLNNVGLTYEQAMATIHVKDEDQTMLTGIPAFIAVWSRLPYYRRVAGMINSVPYSLRILGYFYTFFAKYRLFLTGRSTFKKADNNEPN